VQGGAGVQPPWHSGGARDDSRRPCDSGGALQQGLASAAAAAQQAPGPLAAPHIVGRAATHTGHVRVSGSHAPHARAAASLALRAPAGAHARCQSDGGLSVGTKRARSASVSIAAMLDDEDITVDDL